MLNSPPLGFRLLAFKLRHERGFFGFDFGLRPRVGGGRDDCLFRRRRLARRGAVRGLFAFALGGDAGGFQRGGVRHFRLHPRALHGDGFSFLEALYVHAPAGELGGESRVLPLFADCERQMPVLHNRHGGLRMLFQLHPNHARGVQRVGDELGYVPVPFENVNLLALQFVHDVFDADAAQSDA